MKNYNTKKLYEVKDIIDYRSIEARTLKYYSLHKKWTTQNITRVN